MGKCSRLASQLAHSVVVVDGFMSTAICMEKDYSSSARPHWPCLLVGVEQANALNVDTATATSSPISVARYKMRHEQRVYEHRAFSSDIVRTISKETNI